MRTRQVTLALVLTGLSCPGCVTTPFQSKFLSFVSQERSRGYIVTSARDAEVRTFER